MFGQFRKLLSNPGIRKTVLACGLTYSTLSLSRSMVYRTAEQQQVKLNQIIETFKFSQKQLQDLSKLKTIEVCNITDIPQDKPYMVKIQDRQGNQHLVAIVKYKGTLYAVLGTCPYQDKAQTLVETNFGEKQPKKSLDKNSFEGAIIFNDKMYCPHHGCAFDIQTGSVQYGPALYNLPRFRVSEENGKVFLQHPMKIPKMLIPQVETQNQQDARIVSIIGGDGPAVLGCLDGLRQYGYTGKITVVQQQPAYPYQKHNLHKLIPNFREKLALKPRKKLPKKNQKLALNQIDKQISQLLQVKLYNRLRYRAQQWYKDLGINFIFTDDTFRLIGKRMYPYLSFSQGMRIEYDGLLVAPEAQFIYPFIPGINYGSQRPPNVFLPYKNAKQHEKLVKFLNLYDIKSMAIFGFNQEVLQFCEAVTTSFPDIKIKVLDTNKNSPFSEHYGPSVAQVVIQQYKKHNVQFYIKIQQIQSITNRMQKRLIGKAKDKKSNPQNSKKLQNSIQIVFPDGQKIQSDCAVLFANNVKCNTEGIKKGKNSDVQFTQAGRLIVNSHCKSDSRRIFGAGTSASMEFFFTKSRIQTNNPLVGYEQGLASAFNIMAMNVPFHYIPFQRRKFFDKTIFFAGNLCQQVSNILVYGDVSKWDFLCVYAKQNMIVGISASPSKQRDFNIMRQAFRLECNPQFDELLNDKWNFKNIQRLIRKLNKSGCYRDPVHKLEDNINLGDLIWVQRNNNPGYQNDHPLKAQQQNLKEIDQKGYVRQL